MAVTEQQIAQWSDYHGSTPRPKEFEAFWAAQMAAADKEPLKYEITPADLPVFPGCQWFELRFQGKDGAWLYAKYLRPDTAEDVPLVLQFHGYPGASRSWAEQASYVGMGCALIAPDCPGQGGLGFDTFPRKGSTVVGHLAQGLEGPLEDMYYVRLHYNIRILCRIVEELSGIDRKRIFINGASQGGALGIACAALNHHLINRAAILYPFLSDFRLVWELNADQIAYADLNYYARWYDFEGAQLDRWMEKMAYFDTKNFAPMVKCPVLFGTGLADEVCPPKTQCAVYNLLSCKKERHLFEGFAHEEIQAFDDLIIDFFGREEPLS